MKFGRLARGGQHYITAAAAAKNREAIFKCRSPSHCKTETRLQVEINTSTHMENRNGLQVEAETDSKTEILLTAVAKKS